MTKRRSNISYLLAPPLFPWRIALLHCRESNLTVMNECSSHCIRERKVSVQMIQQSCNKHTLSKIHVFKWFVKKSQKIENSHFARGRVALYMKCRFHHCCLFVVETHGSHARLKKSPPRSSLLLLWHTKNCQNSPLLLRRNSLALLFLLHQNTIYVGSRYQKILQIVSECTIPDTIEFGMQMYWHFPML